MKGNCCEGNCAGAGCGMEGCNCECHKCDCCGPNMNKDKMMFMMMMDSADEAYNRVMMDKMKAVFEKKLGKDMDKSAEFFVDQSIKKWMNEEEWMKNKDATMAAFAKRMADMKK